LQVGASLQFAYKSASLEAQYFCFKLNDPLTNATTDDGIGEIVGLSEIE
jgi:hypothetical protein